MSPWADNVMMVIAAIATYIATAYCCEEMHAMRACVRTCIIMHAMCTASVVGCERLALRCGAIASHCNTMCVPVSVDCEQGELTLWVTLSEAQ